MFPRLSGMYFSTLFFFGLVGLSVANPIPSGNDGFRYEVGPSQPEPAPENFDIDLTYEEPQRGPYTVDLLPAGRQIGSRFGPAANVAELQNFKYEGVVDPTGFYELYSVVGHLLPDTERTDSGIMFSMCVKYYLGYESRSFNLPFKWNLSSQERFRLRDITFACVDRINFAVALDPEGLFDAHWAFVKEKSNTRLY